MKKWLKLWIMALSVIWMFAIIFMSSNNTEAAQATIKLTLSSWWTSSCTLAWTAEFSWTASASQQNATSVTNTIVANCSLYRTWAEYVKITTSNLTWSTTSQTIARTQFKLKNTCSNAAWVSGTCGVETETAVPTNGLQTIYSKTANKIWTIRLSETYSLVIPAWQVQDTYNGTATVDVYTTA